jgi:hypothetical protein
VRRLMLAGLLALGAARLDAQTARAGGAGTQKIDSIVVLNEDVFAREEEQLSAFAKLANALHVRTRAATIRRTLLVNQGDVYDSARVVESERALRSLAVFRSVALDTAWVRDKLYLLVVTGDGWSTRPEMSFTTAAGDATWNVGLTEENFLGTATEVGLGYTHGVDRNALEVAYRNPHFLWRRAILVLRYANLSDGDRASWRVGMPFAQTSARFALETSGETSQGLVLQFREGQRSDTLQRRVTRVAVRGGIALSATSTSYTRLWGIGAIRREDYGEPNTVLPRSTYVAVGAGLDFARTRFQILRHFNSFARREDRDLSQVARVGLWLAPRAWGYESGRAGIGPEIFLQGSALWTRGFGILRLAGHGVFAGAGLDSGRTSVSLTLGSQNIPNQSLVLHAEVAAAKNPSPGDEFDFWFDRSGPRLFGAHAFTGTRFVWVALEDRIVLNDDFYGVVGLGIAPFFDWGGVWFPEDGTRFGGNIGLAFRLGPTRAIQGDPAEIAFGWRFGDGWRTDINGEEQGRWALTIRRALRF